MEQLTNIIGHRLTIGFKGRITKGFKLSPEVLITLKNNSNVSEVVFVLRKIEGFDADCIEPWLASIKELSDQKYDLTFIECPKELLEVVLKNMKKANLKTIRSFIVPYYCSSCNEEYPQLINTSSMSLSFSSYNKPQCPTCKKQLSIDITEEELARIASLLPDHDVFSDKRQHPRFDISSYNIIFNFEVGGKKYPAQLLNFSESGICFTSVMRFDAGKNIVAEIEWHTSTAKSEGTIVWASTLEDSKYVYGAALVENDIFQLLIRS